MLFAALRIEDGQNHDLDIAVDAGERLFKRRDRFGFVRFDGYPDRAAAENLAQNLNAGADPVGAFYHGAEIGSEVGFALGAVQDKILAALARRRIELHRGGKSGASHAADSRVLHAFEQFLAARALPVERGKRFAFALFGVGLDDDRVGGTAGGTEPLLHRFHRTGRGRTHRHGNEAVSLADELPLLDMIADGDHALGGRAEVLRHRHRQFLRHRQTLDRLVAGEIFVVRRMHPAFELEFGFCDFHPLTHFYFRALFYHFYASQSSPPSPEPGPQTKL